METLLLFLGLIVIFVISFFYGVLSWGLVVWKYWYWFLIPVFPALPALTFLQAIGIMCFISLFKTHPSQVLKDEYTDKLKGLILSIIAPWFTLLIGWIIKSYIIS